jgi:hypothetical protein
VGFDSDTPPTFQRLMDFIQRSGIVTAMVGLLQAPHGTLLYERLKRAGRLLERMSGDNVDGSTNIIPVMPTEVLRSGYRRLVQRLYAPDAYYERVRTFLQEYRPPRIRIRIDWRNLGDYLLAFLRSIYRLGFAGKERLQYWKLFLWTLFRRPRSFPLAIRFAIYGYHFRKISQSIFPGNGGVPATHD